MEAVNQKRFLSTKDITIIAMLVAFITISAQIYISFGQIPITLQTFAVFMTSNLFGAKKSTIAVIIYILLGAVGCPVFSSMTGGLSVIIGSKGGYIIGFLGITIVVGLVTKYIRFKNKVGNIITSVAAMAIGDMICFGIGTAQFMFLTKTSLSVAITYCVIPFIVPDIIKMIIAALFVDRVKKNARHTAGMVLQ